MSENEQQVMHLAEAIHRARNDLGTIASMLQLQARMSDDAAVSEALTAACYRVVAIARVNQALDDAARTEPLIDAQGFLEGIASDLQAATQGRPITIMAMSAPALLLPVNYARPLGLVANEWVTNALKYAFPNGHPGTVTIALSTCDQGCHLTIRDDGIGLDPAAAPSGTGLGTRLARGLARQLNGKIKVTAQEDGGTSCTMIFPMPSTSREVSFGQFASP